MDTEESERLRPLRNKWSGLGLRILVSCLVLLILVPRPVAGAKYSPSQSKCSSCRYLVKTFEEGVSKTAGRKWTGGDAHWEAEKLGKYETSETRLVEIMEHVCKKPKDKTDRDFGLDALQDNSDHKCHQFVEQHEEELENWYFHKQRNHPDLIQYLCIDTIKVCCPSQKWGPDCADCPRFGDAVCSGHGTCDGDGVRGGSGKCSCHEGYQGALCRKCATNWIPSHQNETSITCKKCDDSCKGQCNNVGPKGCSSCKDGYVWDEQKGCQDVDECEEGAPCEDVAHSVCANSPGSYSCDCEDTYKKEGGQCVIDVEALKKAAEEKEKNATEETPSDSDNSEPENEENEEEKDEL